MIVGADSASDRTILHTSASLYSSFGMRRVYYSAFSPIPDASARLPLMQPPLVREHRLYQADWLIRFYGFGHDEIIPGHASDDAASTTPGSGMLSLDMDPKLAWALANRARFPVDLNKAPREMLLRVPGLGIKAVTRILQARRVRNVRADDLLRLHVPLKKVMPFVLLPDHHPGAALDAGHLAASLQAPQQRGLFDEPSAPTDIEPAAPLPSAPLPTAMRPEPAPRLGSGYEERSLVWVQ